MYSNNQRNHFALSTKRIQLPNTKEYQILTRTGSIQQSHILAAPKARKKIHQSIYLVPLLQQQTDSRTNLTPRNKEATGSYTGGGGGGSAWRVSVRRSRRGGDPGPSWRRRGGRRPDARMERRVDWRCQPVGSQESPREDFYFIFLCFPPLLCLAFFPGYVRSRDDPCPEVMARSGRKFYSPPSRLLDQGVGCDERRWKRGLT